MPHASRQFWHLHVHVFELCYQAKREIGDPQHMQSLLNTVLSNLVVTHIALPIIQRLTLGAFKEGKQSSSTTLNEPCTMLSQAQPSFAAVADALLTQRSFELKSSWFVLDMTTEPPPEYCDIYILWHSKSTRTFEIISRQDFVLQEEYDELIRVYKGRFIARFKQMIYVIRFDELVKNLKPGSLSSLRCPHLSSAQVGVLPQVDHSNGDIHEAAFSRMKKRKRSPASISSHKAAPPKARLRAQSDCTHSACAVRSLSRIRKGRLVEESSSVFVKGTLMKVSSHAKAFAGDICAVQHVEHVLEGKAEVQMVYLELRDRSRTFKLPATLLQPLRDDHCMPPLTISSKPPGTALPLMAASAASDAIAEASAEASAEDFAEMGADNEFDVIVMSDTEDAEADEPGAITHK